VNSANFLTVFRTHRNLFPALRRFEFYEHLLVIAVIVIMAARSSIQMQTL